MKKLLVILSNWRVAEKIIPVLPHLSKEYILDYYMVGQFSSKTPWYGNDDPRYHFINNYEHYSNDYWSGPEFKQPGVYDALFKKHPATEYDGVIFDDNRRVPEIEMQKIYHEFKKKDIPVFGNAHGNQNFDAYRLEALGKTFDYAFVLGEKEKLVYSQVYDSDKLLKGGIPGNDILGKLPWKPKHVLLIINFLANRNGPFPVKFDKHLVDQTNLIALSKKYDLPIIVKNKARHDDPDYKKNEAFINSWFNKTDVEYEIITDTDNDQLIANSKIVISAPSTFGFKPIQLGIPTILIKGSGQVGNFYDFNGLVSLERDSVIDAVEEQEQEDEYVKMEFVYNTIEGGCEFNSTGAYIREINKIV